MKASELVRSILTTNPNHCNFNRSIVLMVRDHPIDMREGHMTTALKYAAVDEDIRLELQGMRSYIDDALRFASILEDAA